MGFRLSRIVVALLAGVWLAPAAARGADPQPIVILVSVDGWRWDYLDRMPAPNLRALAARGVRAEGLIPPFPSKTFPSHYTLVTGLTPEHHGIVGNAIVDSRIPDRFTMSAPTAKDARWWGGEPLWLAAMRQDQRAASMFWPGSEVNGRQPTYWRAFDDTLPNDARVAQVLDWLALPVDRRPSFITLYFSTVDSAGHNFGPRSREVEQAAAQVDAAIGQLVEGIRRLNLLAETTLVVVSDHGMSEVSNDRAIFLDDYADLSGFDVVEWSPNLVVRPRTGSMDTLATALRGKHPALTVFTRKEIPATLHYRNNPRIPEVLAMATDGWTLTTHARFTPAPGARGEHGYDPGFASMHGLFIAAGPRLREGITAPRFESVHIYEFLCALLGLRPAPNDGDPSVMRGFLR